MEYALIDTGVWYGVFDPNDRYFSQATSMTEYFDHVELVVPWPTVYETLHTHFVRKKPALHRFEKFLKSRKITYIDDVKYRDDALQDALEFSLRKGRPLSMVDCLMRRILDDQNVKIDYLLTFNRRDFFDVCHKNRVEFL